MIIQVGSAANTASTARDTFRALSKAEHVAGLGTGCDRPWLSLNYEGRLVTGDGHRRSRPFAVRPVPDEIAIPAGTRRPFPVEVTAAVLDGELVTSWRWSAGSGLGTSVQAMAERYRAALAEVTAAEAFS